jgi:hypothetical protein
MPLSSTFVTEKAFVPGSPLPCCLDAGPKDRLAVATGDMAHADAGILDDRILGLSEIEIEPVAWY